MRRKFTLADLDATLASLDAGAIHHLQRPDYQRLFGENDVALRRLRHFARGHNCIASFTDGSVLLRKRFPMSPESATT